MVKQTTIYQAVVGLDFEGLKPPVRVESGGAIPDKVPAAEIRQLMADGLVKEINVGESEGDA